MKIAVLNSGDVKLAKSLFFSFQDDDEVENPTSPSDKYIEKVLSKEDFYVIVAITDGKVIGGLTAYELAAYKNEDAEMFLFELGVDEHHRRKGVATALIEKLKDVCRDKGIKEMFLDADEDNLSAIKLYEKTGGRAKKVVEFSYQIKISI